MIDKDKNKNILILVLILFLVGFIVFGGRTIKLKTSELKELNLKNGLLVKKNDSIISININLDKEIQSINKVIKVKEDSLTLVTNKIKILENGKNKVGSFVGGLDINGVDRALTEYLETRQD